MLIILKDYTLLSNTRIAHSRVEKERADSVSRTHDGLVEVRDPAQYAKASNFVL